MSKDRRFKAAVIAFVSVVALLAGARTAAAADDMWLRIVCAPFDRGSIMWDLLGCNALPDDGHPPQG